MFTLTEKEIENMVLDCVGFKREASEVANKRKAQLALEVARTQAEAEEEQRRREAVVEQLRREAEARVHIDIWGHGYKLFIFSIFIFKKRSIFRIKLKDSEEKKCVFFLSQPNYLRIIRIAKFYN